MGGKLYTREMKINDYAKLRIQGMSSHKLVDKIMEDEDVSYSTARRWLKETQDYITSIQEKDADNAYSDAIARLEDLYDSAEDRNLRLRIQAELNKLQGINKPQKMDVTTNGESININEITIKIINDKDELQED